MGQNLMFIVQNSANKLFQNVKKKRKKFHTCRAKEYGIQVRKPFK